MALKSVPLPKIFLLPGQLAAVAQPSELVTVLGSCVGLVLYDRDAGAAGMSHYLLARSTPGEPAGHRYGEIAIPALVAALEDLGCRRHAMEGLVFGGANVLRDVAIGKAVGEDNVTIAFSALAELKIPIRVRDTGGSVGRHLSFRTDSFEARCSAMGAGPRRRHG